ncbi:receptor-like protein Cf-9 homolog [Gossypium arboreum]|uniref:receptor-like protein Cf-9 homolog n=1 Tax=Gossypium arboreum TaxID=29729 RepID=UPI0022F1DBB9|nr:receptor-like protein Cf-9 homolog [Gossypium arboreum]
MENCKPTRTPVSNTEIFSTTDGAPPTDATRFLCFKTHFSINQSSSKDCEYSYPKTTSRKKGTDCCLWDGVSCDNITGEVISLDLSCSCLSGTFPSNTTFFLLSSLQRLDLSFNDFRKSEISFNFSRFPSLTHLNLSSSWFSGPVPYEISYLSNLVSLHLSYRPSIDLIGFQAPGPILTLEKSAVNRIVRNLTQVREIDLDGIDMSSIDPNSFINLSYSLTSLSLLGCHLRGKFPDNIFKHPNIEYLSLDENPKLTGQFPKSNWSSPLVVLSAFDSIFTCKPRKLRILALGYNQLEGCIPNNPNAFPNLSYLDLSDNFLSGTTPSWLYTIPLLRYLNLGNNQFNGHISEFQNRLLITIILKDNSFRGPIPSLISKLVNLTFLDLSSNFIEGGLPKLPPNIRFLSVSYNNLTGNFPHICISKFLEILDLSHNNFSGVIPQYIGSFSKNLSSLNLKMNKLHGTIPSTFAKRCALKNLNLNSNHLEGPLTPSITNCKDLQVLDVGNNMINDSFPHWIETLSELQVLVLHSNKFHGPITAPTSSGSLPKLRIVDLSCNNFFGPLPTGYIKNFKGMINILDDGQGVRYMGERNYSYNFSVTIAVKGFEIELMKILTIFTSIDLSSNNFEGQIPRDIGELSSLRGLNLSHNNLIGHILTSLRNMTRLEWLDLSSNKLSGQIPTGLLDLTFLSVFNVSYNQLVGRIPHGNQFNTFENASYQGNEGLCGVPLSRGCSNKVLGQPLPAPWTNSHEDGG